MLLVFVNEVDRVNLQHFGKSQNRREAWFYLIVLYLRDLLLRYAALFGKPVLSKELALACSFQPSTNFQRSNWRFHLSRLLSRRLHYRDFTLFGLKSKAYALTALYKGNKILSDTEKTPEGILADNSEVTATGRYPQ